MRPLDLFGCFLPMSATPYLIGGSWTFILFNANLGWSNIWLHSIFQKIKNQYVLCLLIPSTPHGPMWSLSGDISWWRSWPNWSPGWVKLLLGVPKHHFLWRHKTPNMAGCALWDSAQVSALLFPCLIVIVVGASTPTIIFTVFVIFHISFVT